MNELEECLIVGAGLSGAVIAEKLSKKYKVLVIDKRDHIGGNCYDYVNDVGIRVSKYGAHLFHTNNREIFEYIHKFGEWVRWDHRVLAKVDDVLVNLPVNINTVNKLCGTNLINEEEMKTYISTRVENYDEIKNSEEMALSRVGRKIYEKLFQDYTIKQWNLKAKELDKSVLARIPVRYNFDDRYFTDRYQVLPKHGYTKFIENILRSENIEVRLNTDYRDLPEIAEKKYKYIIYTGPIDSYHLGLEKLEYRSLRFEEETVKTQGYAQENSVINYPSKEVEFTRIIEYKHFLNQKSEYTTIVKEYPISEGEPYYPVPNPRNLELYEKYRNLEVPKNVHFLGRLGNYKYFNMDEAILNSLNYYRNYLEPLDSLDSSEPPESLNF